MFAVGNCRHFCAGPSGQRVSCATAVAGAVGESMLPPGGWLACSGFHSSVSPASKVAINNPRLFDKAHGYTNNNERELMSYPRAAYKLWLNVTLVKWLLVPTLAIHE